MRIDSPLPRSPLYACLASAGLVLVFPVLAQTLPTAGSLLQEIKLPAATVPKPDSEVLPAAPPLRPRLAPPSNLRFTVRQLRISGASVFTEAQLLPLVQDAIGKETDFTGLEDLAARISRHYREAGYTVARAYIPQQDIKDGAVELAVVEGRYSAVTVRGSASAALAGRLGGITAGDVVADAPLEKALLLLNDLPGLSVKSTLQPGASVGTSELVVEVEPGSVFSGNVETDNHGSHATGRERAGGLLSVNNPAGLGDLLTLRGLTGGRGLYYGRAAWQVPVGGAGTKAGVAASEMRYRLGEEFASLGAKGSARIVTLFAAHPVLRSRGANFNLQASLDEKRIEDRVDSVAVTTNKALTVLSLGASGDLRDNVAGGGVSVLSATYMHGRLRILSPAALAIDEASARTNGSFGKLALSAIRVQTLGQATSLYLSYSGQWTSKNLDSSEKMALGGAGAVRAYPSGEASSDRAQLLTLELRQQLGAGWQLTGFIDAAHGTTNQQRWAAATGAATRSLRGAGLGLAWAQADGWSARVVYAHKLGNGTATAEADRNGRFWLQASKAF